MSKWKKFDKKEKRLIKLLLTKIERDISNQEKIKVRKINQEWKFTIECKSKKQQMIKKTTGILREKS